MSRLIAYMGNDPQRVACALYPARKALVTDPAEVDSWGIGFYQGEVLLQRRPKAPTEPIDFYAVARELRTDCIIAHARKGTFGSPKNENTHPFRFRSWLFAHHGAVPEFPASQPAMLERVPDFLRRNIRGQTDSEHLFHLVLAQLHERGRLDDPNVPVQVVADAVRAGLAGVGGECALAITNGRVLVATRRGAPVHTMRRQSVTDCPVCREPSPPKRIDHEHLRAVIIVADAPESALEGFTEVPDHHFILVNHELKLSVEPI